MHEKGGVAISTQVTLAVIGAGNRGKDVYACWALENPWAARVVAVADPDEQRRTSLADEHGIDEALRFQSWQELLARPAWPTPSSSPRRIGCTSHPRCGLWSLATTFCWRSPSHRLVQETLPWPRPGQRQVAVSITVAHVLRYTLFFSDAQTAAG